LVPATRTKLPEIRKGITHRFNIGGYKGYITANVYDDGYPGEIFVHIAKEGSTLAGMMDWISLVTSIALQHGVPLKLLCEKARNTRFEPQGWTENQHLGYATSVIDYVFRWMEYKFIDTQVSAQLALPISEKKEVKAITSYDESAPACTQCGMLMQRAGSCYTCGSCGTTSGCG